MRIAGLVVLAALLGSTGCGSSSSLVAEPDGPRLEGAYLFGFTLDRECQAQTGLAHFEVPFTFPASRSEEVYSAPDASGLSARVRYYFSENPPHPWQAFGHAKTLNVLYTAAPGLQVSFDAALFGTPQVMGGRVQLIDGFWGGVVTVVRSGESARTCVASSALLATLAR